MASSSAEAPCPGGGARPVPAEELPNLRHLRLLDAAVALSSLTQAAEAVHITQPAASQAVARLARLFGVRLLERAGNGVLPTPEGAIVRERARRALDHLAEANRRLAQRSRLGRGLAGDLLERHATMAQLRALAMFAETGSFSAAARRLGQTEPALQRAAREVERLTGLALFDGAPRALRLTEAGAELARAGSLALKEIASARAELRERAGLFDGRLVIGTLPLVRTRIVPEAAVALAARHPAAHLEIIDGAYESLVQALRIGACDLIAGALREAALAAGLAEEPLFRDGLRIVARAGHPLAGRRVRGPELAAFPWVLPRRDTPSRAIFDRLMAEDGIADPARGHVETGSLVALRGILLASDAVSLISLRQIDHELAQGLLVALDYPMPPTERAIGITTLAGWRPTRLQADFLDCLRAAAAR